MKIKRYAELATTQATPEPVTKGKTLTVTGTLTRADWNTNTYTGFAAIAGAPATATVADVIVGAVASGGGEADSGCRGGAQTPPKGRAAGEVRAEDVCRTIPNSTIEPLLCPTGVSLNVHAVSPCTNCS
ncbi:hypothetical protein [Streptomyces durhamensis]|uniref:hypothetical protein n=1 Tax=Streptomyces durhamensis TaxID=68194 RepID=UPI000D14711E|nr:hypothetical protein [Streptomyces durhamensis]